MVQGSMREPYEITITIPPLKPALWDTIRAQAVLQLDSLADLLTGRFPEGLKEVFFAQGQGLFPEPTELDLDCSCPDYTDCCKHVAAILYGIGRRLDAAPDLFFVLRQVSTEELIKQTVKATAAALVKKGDVAAATEVLPDSDLAGVFGITMDESAPPPAAPPAAGKPAAKAASVKAASKTPPPPMRKAKAKAKTAAKVAKAAPRPATKGKTSAAKPAAPPTKTAAKAKGAKAKTKAPPTPAEPLPAGKPRPGEMVHQLMDVVRHLRADLTAPTIAKYFPDWTAQQIVGTLARSSHAGLLKRVAPSTFRVS